MNPINQEYLNSFARRVGKTLSKTPQSLLEEKLADYTISNHQFNLHRKYILEIGSGHGDFIVSQAKKNPDITYVACEPYINGVAKLLEKLELEKITNILIWTDDVRLLLADLPDDLFEAVFILFPDPWPKKKHKKRRIINNYLLDKLQNKIRKNGKICTATDDQDYAESILSVFAGDQSYRKNKERDNSKSFDEDVITHYQSKAQHEKRNCFFFEFISCD